MWGLQNYEGMLVTMVVTLVVGSGLIVLTLLAWSTLENDKEPFRKNTLPITSLKRER